MGREEGSRRIWEQESRESNRLQVGPTGVLTPLGNAWDLWGGAALGGIHTEHGMGFEASYVDATV